MNTQTNQHENNSDNQKRKLDKQLDSIGWGLFFIMIGVLWFLPEGLVHEDTWLIGIALIIFGENGIRYLYGIKISGFWTVITVIALIFGISGVYGLELPIFQVLLILFGISIILKPWKEFKKFNCFYMMNEMWGGKTKNNN